MKTVRGPPIHYRMTRLMSIAMTFIMSKVLQPDTTPAAVIPTVASAPPADLNVSVGDTAPFDYGKKLFSQLNELKTAFIYL